MTNSDFHDLGRAETVRWTLFTLKGRGEIRELMAGIYDYPAYSELLGETLAPDADRVARAIARRHGWHIQATGNTALNMLGISTQVPGRLVYLSNGPSKVYTKITPNIEFRRAGMKESCFAYRKSELVVQAIRTLGRDGVTGEAAEKIRRYISTEREWQRILKDARTAPAWIGNILITLHNESQQ